MNKTKIAILLGIILLASSNLVMLVNASPSNSNNEGSLNSGYAVTNNYHGIDVPAGAQVIVTAMSTDRDVDKVVFIWKNAAGQIVNTETVNVYTNGTRYPDNPSGKLVRYASSSYTPNTLGDWGVQAKFYETSGQCCGQCDTILATRATSFNVIPEVPLLGTAGISIAMVLGLAIFKVKKKQP